MSQPTFSPDWLKKFPDPYSVLGVSVAADDRRILKRYRQIAKQLHPDVHVDSDTSNDFSSQVLARLVNPSYQRLKQDKGRAETLATLRFKVRRLLREEKLIPRTPLGKQLLELEEAEVDVFYEQQLSQLSENQYTSPSVFERTTLTIAELNLVYLRRKMGDVVIREKRTGLVAASEVSQDTTPVTTGEVAVKHPETNYAHRHFERAQKYVLSQNYIKAIDELRDAIKIEPTNSDYHAMLGDVYSKQKLLGMAKVHLRQAIKLNPRHKLALTRAREMGIDISDLQSEQPKAQKKKDGGLFGMFAKKH